MIFPPEFNLERELCNSSVLSSHTWIKTLNLIISSQVREDGYFFKQFSTYVIRMQYTVIKAIILEGYINRLSKTALKFENNRQRLFALTMCLPACL